MHSGNITSDEIVNIAQQRQHRSLARELSENIKGILGTAQSLGCDPDGHHPHDVTDGISRVLWAAQLVSSCRGKYVN